MMMERESGRKSRRRRRSWARAASIGAALAVGAASLALTSPVQGLDRNAVGGLDARGFPTFYTDDSGLSLQVCEDGSANCLGATTADLADRTDGEAFYWMAAAELPTSRGDLSVEFALEAAFAATDEPMVFDRLRVRGDLTRAGRYTLLTPYGRQRITAEGLGPRNVNFTQDDVCALTPGGGCPGRITNFLRSPNAPTGYLGGGETATRVIGGTVRNKLALLAPGGRVLGSTARFAVMGKLAPGPAAGLSTDLVNFGNQARTTRRGVTVNNLGDSALDFASIRVAGATTIRVARTGCAAQASLPAGGSCRVNLLYRPGARKVSTASLIIDDNTNVGLHRIPVKAMTAAVFSAPRRVHFTARKVGTESGARRVVVENTGVLPMRIGSISIAGGDARSFERRNGQAPRCAKGMSVRPGRACAIYVAFAPKTFGPKSSTLTVRSSAANSPSRVALGGRGR